MKNRTYITVGMLALAFAGCDKPGVTTAPPTPPPVVSTPPPATPIAVVATPEPVQLAPDGVFFLISAVSITTDEGITGLKPGTRLNQVGDDTYKSGEHEVKLAPDQVTNDLKIAGQVMAATHASDAAMAAFRRTQADAVELQKAAAIAAAATPVPVATPGTLKVVHVYQTAEQAKAKPEFQSGLSGGAYNEDKNVVRPRWYYYYDAYGVLRRR
jgi:hypothetical protein